MNEALSQRDNTDKLEWMQRHVICEGLQERLVFNSLTNILGPRKLLHTGVVHKVSAALFLILHQFYLLLLFLNYADILCPQVKHKREALADVIVLLFC